MNEFLEVISQYGIPVACMAAMGLYLYKRENQVREDTQAREDKMYEQLDKFSDSLDKFNSTLTSIDKRLEVVEQEILKSIDSE